MDIVEGQVAEHNCMGKAMFVKVESQENKGTMLYFRRDDLGEEAWSHIRAINLADTLRVEVGPEMPGRGGPFHPVLKFID